MAVSSRFYITLLQHSTLRTALTWYNIRKPQKKKTFFVVSNTTSSSKPRHRKCIWVFTEDKQNEGEIHAWQKVTGSFIPKFYTSHLQKYYLKQLEKVVAHQRRAKITPKLFRSVLFHQWFWKKTCNVAKDFRFILDANFSFNVSEWKASFAGSHQGY